MPEGKYTAVYNFEVADFHTYFVSDFDVLVHGDTEVYINVKRCILGYGFDNDSIHMMSKSESALDKLEQDSGILDEYL